jgi:glycerol-3-phosphate dehydrogenase
MHQLSAGHPELNELLHPLLPYRRREVVWAARYEMARTVEDVLARRTHALFLNARATIEATPSVVRLLAGELKRSEEWMKQDLERFLTVARRYIYAEE